MAILKSKMHILFLVAALLCGSRALAQQEPQFTQYMFNTMSVNPGSTGVNEALNVTFQSRQQWVGLSGAPQSYALSANSPFINYNMGLGLSVITDKYGPINNTYVTANYAYKIKLNNKLTLSMGLKAGIYNYYASLTDLDINNAGEDPIFQENLVKYFQPNVGLGLYLYHKDYYFGVAIPKMVQTDLNSDAQTQNTISDLRRHFYFIGGYTYAIDSDWKVKGSFLEKMVSGAPPSTDLSFQGVYLDRYWAGITYRIGDAVALILDFQITPELMVGYSYDINISNLSGYNSGSHELVLSYNFKDLVAMRGGKKARANSSFFKKRK